MTSSVVRSLRPVPSPDPRPNPLLVAHPDSGTREALTLELLGDAAELDAVDPALARARRDQAVVVNRPLALGVARRYARRGVEQDDLEQVACLGLCKAVNGFRVSEGRSFTAYAVPTISGEVKRHFRDHAWAVRPGRHLQEMAQLVHGAAPELMQQLGHEPSTAELAAHLGLDPHAVANARVVDRSFAGLSLDAPIGPNGSTDLGSFLPDEAPAIEDVISSRLQIDQALGLLDSRERLIVRFRFVDGLSQREIGQIIGVSQMQVSRLLSGILRVLRDALEPVVGHTDTVSA